MFYFKPRNSDFVLQLWGKIRKESLLWFCMRDSATMTLHLPDSKITEHLLFVLLSVHELGTQEDARPRQLTIQEATLSYQSFQCHHNVSYVKPSRGFFPIFLQSYETKSGTKWLGTKLYCILLFLHTGTLPNTNV